MFRAAQLASIRQMSMQVSRGSAAEYQAKEQADVARLSDFTFTFHFHALEKEMATHSSVLAWRIPGMPTHLPDTPKLSRANPALSSA